MRGMRWDRGVVDKKIFFKKILKIFLDVDVYPVCLFIYGKEISYM